MALDGCIIVFGISHSSQLDAASGLISSADDILWTSTELGGSRLDSEVLLLLVDPSAVLLSFFEGLIFIFPPSSVPTSGGAEITLPLLSSRNVIDVAGSRAVLEVFWTSSDSLLVLLVELSLVASNKSEGAK